MTGQIAAADAAARPIHFENYAVLYELLTAARQELDAEICDWCFRPLLPNGKELSAAWFEVDAAHRALSELLDAADKRYSLPASPRLPMARTMSLHYWEREAFDNHELLGELFPPAARPELEARVLRSRDTLVAYFGRLTATFRRLLHRTRIRKTLVNERLRPMDLSAWLRADLANIDRFQLFLSGEPDAFEGFAAVREACRATIANLDDLWPPFEGVENESTTRLLKRYITRADRFRGEVLEEFADRFSFHVRHLPNMNPRWSESGEPAILPAEQANRP